MIPSLSRKVLAAAALISASAVMHAGIMDDSISVQTYRDFAENRGVFAPDATNVVVTDINGNYVGTITRMMNFDSVVDGGWSALTGGASFLSTVAHNNSTNVTFTERFGATVGTPYYDTYHMINYNRGWGTNGSSNYDYAVPRLNKIVTEAEAVPYLTDTSILNNMVGREVLRVGGGSQTVAYGVNQEASVGGAYSYLTGGTITFTGETVRIPQPGVVPPNANGTTYTSQVVDPNAPASAYNSYSFTYNNQVPDAAQPLDIGARGGDSGSASWTYNTNTAQWEYVGAAQSVGGSGTNTFNQMRSGNAYAVAVIEAYNSPTITPTSGGGNITWNTPDANGAGTFTQGATSWSYVGLAAGVHGATSTTSANGSTTAATDAQMDATRNLVLGGAGGTIVLGGSIDMGAGSLTFNSNYTLTDGGVNTRRLNSAGFIVNAGVTVTTQLTGASGDEWRKIGDGKMIVSGTGANLADLNIGGGGIVELNRTGGAAARNVKINGGGATVRLIGANQISGDVIFGHRGGTLDLYGNNFSDAAITHLDDGARIANFKANSASTFTFTGSGAQKYLGDFTDGGSLANGLLNLTYNPGTPAGASWTMNGATSIAGTVNIAGGQLIVKGTPTLHAGGYIDPNDWQRASFSSGTVNVAAGAGFTLGTHADSASAIALSGSTSTFVADIQSGYSAQTGAISGSGSVTKTGAGTLYLGNTANSFSGTKTLSGGTLIAASIAALGNTTTNAWTIADGTALGVDNATVASLLPYFSANSRAAIALSQTGAVRPDDAPNLTGYQNLFLGATGTATVGASGTTSTLTAWNAAGGWNLGDGGGRLVMNLKLAGNGGLVVGSGLGSQKGTVVLANTGNTFTGGVTVNNGGTLVVGGTAALSTGALTLNNGSTLANNGAGTLTLGNVAFQAGDATFGFGTPTDTGTIRLTQNFSLGNNTRTFFVDRQAASAAVPNPDLRLELTGALSSTGSSGSLTKTGRGTLVLSGNNTYTGTTTVKEGVLLLASASGLGATTASLRTEGGVLDLGNFSVTTNTLTLAGGLLKSGTINASAINASAGVVMTTLTGTAALNKTGSGAVFLGSANTYSGGTTVSAGALVMGNASALGSGPVTVAASGATLNLGNFTVNTGIFTQTGGSIDNGTLKASAFNMTGGTASATLAGTAALTKTGTGTLSLTKANTYSGGTTIEAGTVRFTDNNNALGTGAISVTGDSTIANYDDAARSLSNAVSVAATKTLKLDSGSTTLTLSGVLSGAGSVSKSGSGSLILTNNNTYAGTTTILSSGGTLQVGNGGATGSIGEGAVSLGSNSTLAYNRSAAATVANTISGAGAFAQSGTGTITLSGNNTYTGGTTVNTGTLAIGNGGTTGSIGTGTANLAAGTVLSVNRSDAYKLTNTVTGQGSLALNGTGTTTLTGANTFSGGTTVNAGTLKVGGATALGTGALTMNGGNLAFDAQGLNFNSIAGFSLNTGAVAGGVFTSDFSPLHNTSGAVVPGNTTYAYTGKVYLTAGQWSFGENFDDAAYVKVNDSVVVNNTSWNTPTSGSINIAADGWYDIDVRAFQGAGAAGPVSASGWGPGKGIGVKTGGSSTDGTLYTAFGVDAAGIRLAVGGTVTIANSVNLASNTAFDTADTGPGGAFALTGIISGAGALTKTGTGTLILSGANTYAGGTTLNAGTLTAGSATAFGSGAMTVNTGTLDLDANAVTTGAVSLNGGTLQNGTLTGSSYATSSGSVSAILSGAGSLTQNGAGTTILSGNNTYTGTTTVTSGTLQVGLGGATGSLGSGSVTNNGVLAFNRIDSATVANTISGTGSLAQNGSGTLILTGNNSYSGGTTVADGTLQIGAGGSTGSFGSGAVSIASGATLAFNRTGSLGVSAVISGAGDVTQSTGEIIFSGNNTYSGGTTISGGFVRISGSDSALGSGTVNFTGDGTLATASGGGARNLANDITIGSGATASLDGGYATLTLSGDISGAGNLAKASSGTVVLTGNNTYTGTTSIAATLGALQVGTGGASGSLGSGSVSIGSGGSLIYNRSDSVTIANAISGSGTLAFIGTGASGQSAYKMTGNNSGMSGAVTATNARAEADNSAGNRLGTGTLTTGTGGQFFLSGGSFANAMTLSGDGWQEAAGLLGALRLSGGANVTGAVTLAGDTRITAYNSSGVISGAIGETGGARALEIGGAGQLPGTVTLSGNNTYTGATTVSSGTLQIGNGGTSGTLGSGAVVNNATLAFNRSDAISVGNTVSGTGALVQNGSGTTTLTGANAYTGGTTVSAGTLALGNSGALGATTGAITVSGGALDLGANAVTAGAVTISGGTIQNGTLTGASYSASSGFVSAILAGSGALTKSGSGTLVLTGANTYAGGTTITGGTLQLGNGVINGTMGGGAYAISSGAALYLNQGATPTNPAWGNITGAGSLILGDASSSFVNYSRPALTAGFTGTLQVNNRGRITATPANLGGTTQVVINNGAQFLAFDGTTAGTAYTFAQNFSINGLGSESGQSYGSLRASGLKATFTGNITLTGDAGLYLQNNTGGAMNVTGVISDGGAGHDLSIAARLSTGAITLSGANTYSGVTTTASNTGTLILNNTNALQNSTLNHTSGTLAFSSAVTSNAFVLGGLSGTSGIGLKNNAPTPAAIALSVGNNNASTSYSGVLSGAGSLAKTGSGSLTLSGNDTYTGGTTVNAGRLIAGHNNAFGTGAVTVNSGGTLNAGLAGSGRTLANAITVNTGGTLMGAATLNGAVTIKSGATLSPGNSPGTLTFNNGVTLASGASYLWEITGAAPSVAGTDFDRIVVTGGNMNIASGVTLKLAALAIDYATSFWDSSQTFTFATKSGTGTITGSFGSLDTSLAGAYSAEGSWSLLTAGNGDLQALWTASSGMQGMSLQAVPEPSTYGLLGAGVLAAVAFVRRRRKIAKAV